MEPKVIEGFVAETNPWRWQAPDQWIATDADLAEADAAPFDYRPGVLESLREGALYLLVGPRRVGKTVEVKRAIASLISNGTDPGRILHAACDGMLEEDLHVLAEVFDRIAPAADGPRYVFLDEITSVGGDWVSRIKWLRDNTSLRSDCVVLTGSSAEQLMKARKQLAGRRGGELQSIRTLLPMGFRAFCKATGAKAPDTGRLPPAELLGPDAERAINELSVFSGPLEVAWEEYLQSGGFPRAVAGWTAQREIPRGFVEDLWEVVHGDALAALEWSEGQSRALLDRLARSIGSPLAIEKMVREASSATRKDILTRLRRLEQTFITWQCPQGDARTVNLSARQKTYFTDPLLARLVSLRGPGGEPNLGQLTEQQLGMALLRSHPDGDSAWSEAAGSLAYQRSATGREIDFVAPWLGGIPFESKYADGPWLRATQTARAAYDGRAVLATRSTTDSSEKARAVPAPALAYLLDQTPESAGPWPRPRP